MSRLQYAWLGYAATSEVAIRIIQETGIFYLIISIAYLFSFLYMVSYSKATRQRMKVHGFGIALWAVFGAALLAYPKTSIPLNAWIMVFVLRVLYMLQFTSPLIAHSELKTPKAKPDDKKSMYANTLLSKTNFTLSDVLGCTLINEQILWVLILYKASIAFRASFGL